MSCEVTSCALGSPCLGVCSSDLRFFTCPPGRAKPVSDSRPQSCLGICAWHDATMAESSRALGTGYHTTILPGSLHTQPEERQ